MIIYINLGVNEESPFEIINQVILHPSCSNIYKKKLFFRYHKWMTNKELQELTASEPLTIEEEYEMQASWRNDKDSE